MSSPLTHSPADIVARFLIREALGSEPPTSTTLLPDASWPVYADAEPFGPPDNVITVYDTAGKVQGREMIRGKILEHYGIQVRFRAVTHLIGWTKAHSVRDGASALYQEVTTFSGYSYLLHALSQFGPVLALGQRSNGCHVFTFNCLATISQLS